MLDNLPLLLSLFAVLTSLTTAFLSWRKLWHEEKKWIKELKKSYAMEIHRNRIIEYPKLLKMLSSLSSVDEHLSTSSYLAVSESINGWLYSSGGLLAEKQLRYCLVELRDELRKESPSIDNISELKHMTTFFMRYDIDIQGLEDISIKNVSILDEMRNDIENIVHKRRGSNTVIGRYKEPTWSPKK